jgi:hypothetical protein
LFIACIETIPNLNTNAFKPKTPFGTITEGRINLSGSSYAVQLQALRHRLSAGLPFIKSVLNC